MKRSRSRSRSYDDRSRSRSNDSRRRRSPSREDYDSQKEDTTVDYVKLTDADAAFILGKNGKTKEKIVRVSGACVELPPRSLTLEITGGYEERRRAKKYVECVMAQRVGEVVLDETDPDFEEDCTVVQVPGDCVGFVTGTNGSFLRQVEQEYGTIMFFVHLKGGRSKKGDTEKLAIFGPWRGRRGAELKVMAAIESRVPELLTKDMEDHISDSEERGTDRRRLKMEEMSWALGKKGATRRKLARASGCIVEYVGNVAHMCGTRTERYYAGQYLSWIMEQLDGPVEIPTDDRDDVTVLHIPHDCVGYVTGLKRATLSRIEDEWGAFMLFMDRKDETVQKEFAKLAIFGLRRNRRGAELKVMSTVEGKTPGFFTKKTREGKESAEWGTDIYLFHGEELSYALGKEGSTKRKLAKAAACIIEYVGDFAYLSGTRAERSRGMRYLKWLLKQRSGAVRMDELGVSRRLEDIDLMTIPKQTIPEVMGQKGCGLRSIEEETATFLFMARDEDNQDALVICGATKACRRQAEHAIHAVVAQVQRGRRSGGGGGGYGSRDWDDRAPSWRGGGRDRYDDGMAMTKYRRDDRYGYDRWDDRRDDRGYGGGGYGGYGDDRRGGGYGDDRRGGGYGDDRRGGGYGDDRRGGYYDDRRSYRSRSRSYDSYDSRDSYDRRDRRDYRRDDKRDSYRSR